MQPQSEQHTAHGLPHLPHELFLNILDWLVGTRDGHQPVAFAPSDPVTKTLRALTLTSRQIYPVASRYLYAHCLFLGNCTSYTRFRRTFGLHIGNHPQALKYGEAGRSEGLFADAEITKHITSLFFSPDVTDSCGNAPMIRLPQIIDLCNVVGPTLKRLAMDIHPVYTVHSEIERIKPHLSTNNIFLSMKSLEELVCSYDTTDYFPFPPPNLKRMAITQQGMDDPLLQFISSAPFLSTLFILRKPEMEANDLHRILNSAPATRGTPLDVVFVDVSANHGTPKGTRDWKDEDIVRLWEVDVPTSYYGDQDDLTLCDYWVWDHAVRGTLFTQNKRRMESRESIRRRLEELNTD